MQPAPITEQPKTVQQVKALPNHGEARSYAAGKLLAIANLPIEGGPMLDKKLFVEDKGNHVVYAFYRQNNKDTIFYVIF